VQYAVEMGPDAMKYIPSFKKIGSDTQKLIRRDTQTQRQHKPTFIVSK
jgi:hypothetical protein